ARYGFDATETWLRFDNSAAPLTLRVNPLRIASGDLVQRLDADGVRVRPGTYAPGAFVVESGHPLRGSGLEQGWFVVQDEASQLVALLASPLRESRVLDTCASPGGKSTAIAAAMQGHGVVVACDVRPRRIDLLYRTVAATG